MDFQIANAGYFDSRLIPIPHREGHITKERLAQNYEIELPVADAKTTYIDNLPYPIRRHYILLAKPGQKRCSVLDFQVHYIHLSHVSDSVKEILDDLPTTFEITEECKYFSVLQAISHATYRDFPGKELYLHSKLYELIYRMHTDAHTDHSSISIHNLPQLEAAKAFLDTNYQKPILLADVAEKAHLSASHFHRLFKSVYGQTPAEYLQSVRLEKAKALLMTTDLSVETIALSCGFSSHRYFNTVFKKSTNLSPRNFQKNALHIYEL